MINLLLIALGGAFGSVARYGVGRLVFMNVYTALPLGTLIVNVVGSFLIGLCVHLIPRDHHLGFFLVTGFLGGFTTFSAFSVETLALFKSDQPVQALIYVALSLFLSLGAVFLGAQVVKSHV